METIVPIALTIPCEELSLKAREKPFSKGDFMNDSTEGRISRSELPIGRLEEGPRGLRRTYRFADGVRVMVWAYDVVVWTYPNGWQIHSEEMGRKLSQMRRHRPGS